MLLQLAEAALEPVSLEDAKEHLRVTHDEHDAYIASHISAARQALELHTGRALVAASYRWIADSWMEAANVLPLWPVEAVSAVRYRDPWGAPATFGGADYILDGDRALLRLSAPVAGALTVDFTTAAPAVMPPALRAAILLLVADLYEQGGGLAKAGDVEINPTVDRLVQPFRLNLGV